MGNAHSSPTLATIDEEEQLMGRGWGQFQQKIAGRTSRFCFDDSLILVLFLLPVSDIQS